MTTNIDGLNTEESKWVCSVLCALLNGEQGYCVCPSKEAWDQLQTDLVST